MTEKTTRSINAVLTGFGIAIAVTAFLSWFLHSKIPQDNILQVVPGILALVTIVLPILLWQTMAPPKTAARISAIASFAIWVLGIVASFQIKPSSELIYVPDSLLLIGFIPLLYHWRFSWPWLVFGVFNFGIGVFLQAIVFIPDTFFPERVLFAKHHLAEYHPSITWWVLGVLALAFGLVRLGKNLWKLARKPKSDAANDNASNRS